MARCTGETTRNCVHMISRAMRGEVVTICDHYYPNRRRYLQNIERNVIPQIKRLLSGMELQGFHFSKSLKGDYLLSFTNPIKGVGDLYEFR